MQDAVLAADITSRKLMDISDIQVRTRNVPPFSLMTAALLCRACTRLKNRRFLCVFFILNDPCTTACLRFLLRHQIEFSPARIPHSHSWRRSTAAPSCTSGTISPPPSLPSKPTTSWAASSGEFSTPHTDFPPCSAAETKLHKAVTSRLTNRITPGVTHVFFFPPRRRAASSKGPAGRLPDGNWTYCSIACKVSSAHHVVNPVYFLFNPCFFHFARTPRMLTLISALCCGDLTDSLLNKTTRLSSTDCRADESRASPASVRARSHRRRCSSSPPRFSAKADGDPPEVDEGKGPSRAS